MPEANAAILIDVEHQPCPYGGALADLLNLVGLEKLGTTVVQDLDRRSPRGPRRAPLPVAQLALYLDYLSSTVPPSPVQHRRRARSSTTPDVAVNLFSGASVKQQSGKCPPVCGMLGTSGATLRLANAYSGPGNRRCGRSVHHPNGFIPFEAAQVPPPKLLTTQPIARVPGEPIAANGGWRSRFPELSRLLGQDPDMPAAGLFTSPDGAVTLEYHHGGCLGL